MPLNYSKWDMLELSDDSDIEEHPNVDKKSMIRWKQRDIHEKREARKLLLAKLRSELSLNEVLRPRIQAVLKGLSEGGLSHFRAVQRRLKEAPSDEKPNTGAANQPTYDMMLGQLLSDVWREGAFLAEGAKVEAGKVVWEGKKVDEKMEPPAWSNEASVPEGKAAGMQKALEGRLEWHLKELDKRDQDVREEISREEKEMNKKITSDGIHDGFSASSVNKPKESPLDDKPTIPAGKPKEKGKVETIEVLNPGAASSSKLPEATSKEDEDDDIDLTLTPSARAFAQIPLGDFEKLYAFIQRDSSVLTEKTHDALLGEAFDAEKRGDKALAMRCVHQSLLVNYCRQLGRDGVGLFFQKWVLFLLHPTISPGLVSGAECQRFKDTLISRMIQKNPKSIQMFNEDFQNTYNRIAQRTKEIAAEEEAMGEREQIQLVAEDPNLTIGFNLPEGPPPEDLRLEGPGTEELDVDQVRAYLQHKWDIFQGFPPKFQAALKTEKLDEVNKVLGRMKVEEAEPLVELLQEGGMLSFSEAGVRDMTK